MKKFIQEYLHYLRIVTLIWLAFISLLLISFVFVVVFGYIVAQIVH